MTTLTCKEALDLARAALEDDTRMTAGPWTASPTDPSVTATGSLAGWRLPITANDATGIAASRTREPELARFVLAMFAREVDAETKLEAVLSAEVDGIHVESARVRVTNGIPDLCIDFHLLTQAVTLYSWQNVRAIAATLLRAADEWEAAHREPHAQL